MEVPAVLLLWRWGGAFLFAHITLAVLCTHIYILLQLFFRPLSYYSGSSILPYFNGFSVTHSLHLYYCGFPMSDINLALLYAHHTCIPWGYFMPPYKGFCTHNLITAVTYCLSSRHLSIRLIRQQTRPCSKVARFKFLFFVFFYSLLYIR